MAAHISGTDSLSRIRATYALMVKHVVILRCRGALNSSVYSSVINSAIKYYGVITESTASVMFGYIWTVNESWVRQNEKGQCGQLWNSGDIQHVPCNANSSVQIWLELLHITFHLSVWEIQITPKHTSKSWYWKSLNDLSKQHIIELDQHQFQNSKYQWCTSGPSIMTPFGRGPLTQSMM